ncbi:MAG: hypothetical protein JWO92_376 [Chitinophagaceae bacterium]|nr:hypothetical protein [Chitinophagaceae bacterium]
MQTLFEKLHLLGIKCLYKDYVIKVSLWIFKKEMEAGQLMCVL